ncbi:ABC transporter substrate-binding protein [Pseudonocardia benzenivorans]
MTGTSQRTENDTNGVRGRFEGWSDEAHAKVRGGGRRRGDRAGARRLRWRDVRGSSGSGSGGGTGDGSIHNPSDAKGGTLRYANSGDWDSLDPADTYYAYSWNFVRLYGRALVMFKSAPGADGATLVPDLAESLGKSSDGGKTWTYTLRKGVKFEDGTPVTSKDVKYAVERSLDKTTFPNGPTYFNDFLDLQGYTSPYEDPRPTSSASRPSRPRTTRRSSST